MFCEALKNWIVEAFCNFKGAVADWHERRKLGGMKKPITPERRLIPTKLVRNVPVAGRCSICHRPFEVSVTSDLLESLRSSNHWLLVDFGSHTCHEDFSVQDRQNDL